jgi:hypothetical protein
MALYLVRATPGRREQRNSNQINGYIVEAANTDDAMTAALAAAPNGESKPKAKWQVVPLADLVPPLLIVGELVVPDNVERRPGA